MGGLLAFFTIPFIFWTRVFTKVFRRAKAASPILGTEVIRSTKKTPKLKPIPPAVLELLKFLTK